MTFETPTMRIEALKQSIPCKNIEELYVVSNGFKIVRNNVLYWKTEYCDIEV